MLVRCIKSDGTVLIEGELYNVIEITKQGNYHLEGVKPPKEFNCFDKARFELEEDPFLDWTELSQRQYWED